MCFVPGTHIPPDVQTGFVQPELLSNNSSNVRSRSVSEEERLKHRKAKRFPSLSDSVFENLDLSSSLTSEKSDSEEKSVTTTTPTRFAKHCNAISHGKPFRIRTDDGHSSRIHRNVDESTASLIERAASLSLDFESAGCRGFTYRKQNGEEFCEFFSSSFNVPLKSAFVCVKNGKVFRNRNEKEEEVRNLTNNEIVSAVEFDKDWYQLSDAYVLP